MAIDTVEAKIMVGIIQNGMSIRPTESKGVDGYSAQPCGRPWSELQRNCPNHPILVHFSKLELQNPYLQVPLVYLDIWIHALKPSVGRNHAFFEDKYALDHASDSTRALEVANVSFDRADIQWLRLAAILAESSADCASFNGI